MAEDLRKEFKPSFNQQREAVFRALEDLMKKDENIWLLYIDLGFSFLEDIQRRFPERCINTGCIEQSAIGIACGLALAGKKPYIFSASNFLIFRALEQVRNDICYQNLNVKLLGFAGRSYNFLGYSHLPQGGEDLKMVNCFPNIVIYIPETPEEAGGLILSTHEDTRPAYIRLK